MGSVRPTVDDFRSKMGDGENDTASSAGNRVNGIPINVPNVIKEHIFILKLTYSKAAPNYKRRLNFGSNF